MQSNTQLNSSNVGPATTGGTVSAAPKGFRQKVSQMLAGLNAGIPDGSSVTVGGQAVAKADLVNEMAQVIPAYQAVDTAVLALKGARSQLRAQLSGFHKQYLDLKDALVAFLGRGNPQLTQFGISASTKAKPLTPAQKVVKAQKALKTRALRHTMGKRQKAAVQYTGQLQVSVDETPPVATPVDGTAMAAAPTVQDIAVAAVPAATPGPAGGHT